MVEGPGCKLNGEKLKARIRGQNVVHVDGDKQTMTKKFKPSEIVTPGPGTHGKTVQASSFHQLIGQTISDVVTLGKELFVFFQDFQHCLRMHFLMSGYLRFNEEGRKTSSASSDTRLVLALSTDVVTFGLGCYDIMDTAKCLSKIEDLRTLDICDERFSHKRALALVGEQQGRLVSDVLLDQAILPGVGNIIKNEALFDSRIKPASKIDELTEAQLSHLIRMTRDFTAIFYKCRKTGKPLERHMKIYNKETCLECGTRVVRTRLGDDSARLTTFCPMCQDNTFKRKLQPKTNLLNWVLSPGSAPEASKDPDWTCERCTLINSGNRSTCKVCMAERPKDFSSFVTAQKQENFQSHTSATESSAATKYKFKKLTSGASTHLNSDISDEDQKFKRQKVEWSKSETAVTTTFSHEHANLTVAAKPSLNSAVKNERGSQNPTKIAPVCPKHKVACTRRQVHKKGDNLHRMFWSCRTRDCNFFMWADEGFPFCETHNKRTVLRTVMKQGNNNGRTFYACPLNKNKQCSFFQWAS